MEFHARYTYCEDYTYQEHGHPVHASASAAGTRSPTVTVTYALKHCTTR